MGAIVDILLLGQDDISLLKKRYPECVLTNLTNSNQLTQRYRVIIPGEELDDSYYYFLLENLIATSSKNFQARLESDEKFTERMKSRVAWLLKDQENTKYKKVP